MQTVWMPGGVQVDIHLRAEDTDGAFSLMVDHPREGWGLPPHRHTNESETIHVVEGRFEVVVDGLPVQAGPGDTVFIPRDVVHSGRLIGTDPGRRVVVFAPGGMDRFFVEAGSPSAEEPRELTELVDIAGRHGWRFG